MLSVITSTFCYFITSVTPVTSLHHILSSHGLIRSILRFEKYGAGTEALHCMPSALGHKIERAGTAGLDNGCGGLTALLIEEDKPHTATKQGDGLGGLCMAMDGDFGAGLQRIEQPLRIVILGVPQVIRLSQPRRSLGLRGKGIEKLVVDYHKYDGICECFNLFYYKTFYIWFQAVFCSKYIAMIFTSHLNLILCISIPLIPSESVISCPSVKIALVIFQHIFQ